jgi:AcrR family transcriptional regulator
VNLRDAQKQQTRARLVDAAAECFRVRGYANTTIDDVASGAGATRATFYLHFRTKSDLVRELMASVHRDTRAVNERLYEAVAAGGRAELRSWIDAAFDFWEVVRAFATAELEAAAVDDDTRRRRARSFDNGVDAIVRGLTERRGPDEAHRVRGVLCYAQLDSAFHRWMQVGWDVDRAEALEVMTAMWWSVLGDVATRRRGAAKLRP